MLGYVGCKLGHFGRAKINQTKTFHLRFVLEAMLGQCWAFVRHVWGKNRLKETGFTRFFQFVFQKSGETMYGILILVAMLSFCRALWPQGERGPVKIESPVDINSMRSSLGIKWPSQPAQGPTQA